MEAGTKVALQQQLSRKPIPAFPEVTDRAPFGIVIDALLMRATHDTVWHRDRFDLVTRDELDDFLPDRLVMAHVGVVREP